MNVFTYPELWLTKIDVSLDDVERVVATAPTLRGCAMKREVLAVTETSADLLREPLPLRRYRALFYTPETSPEITAVVGVPGAWSTLSNFVCKILGAKAVHFDMSVGSADAVRNTLIACDSGVTTRVVQVLYPDEDGNWSFSARGTPLSIEDTVGYQRPNIADRLTKSTLVEYARALGMPVDRPEFFAATSRSLYVERRRGRCELSHPVAGDSAPREEPSHRAGNRARTSAASAATAARPSRRRRSPSFSQLSTLSYRSQRLACWDRRLVVDRAFEHV